MKFRKKKTSNGIFEKTKSCWNKIFIIEKFQILILVTIQIQINLSIFAKIPYNLMKLEKT
jgi:hypothetical protein